MYCMFMQEKRRIMGICKCGECALTLFFLLSKLLTGECGDFNGESTTFGKVCWLCVQKKVLRQSMLNASRH